MANAVITESSSVSNYTYAQLVTAIKTAMTNAGFGSTYFDDQSANTSLRFIVWRIQLDGDNTKARAYIYYRLRIIIDGSDYKLEQRYYYTWNATTHAGTVYTLTVPAGVNIPTNGAGSQVNFTAINHAEFKGVIVNFGTNYGLLGLLTPLNKVDGWNFDNIQYAAAFIPNREFNYLYQPAPIVLDDTNNYVDQISNNPNPMVGGANDGYFLVDNNDTFLGNRRGTNLKYQLIPTLVVGSSSSEGAAAYTSQDLGVVASNGLAWKTKLSDGTKNYMLISPRGQINNGAYSGVVIAIP